MTVAIGRCMPVLDGSELAELEVHKCENHEDDG
jgi:hypothetical protein